jgi:predicted ATP-grasp superfamily ATP-dependent carboligase
MGGSGWVLLTDGTSGQNRSTLAAVRALRMAGYHVAVTVSEPPSRAAASRFCGRVVPVPGVEDPRYADAVRADVEAHEYVAVLPSSDAAMVALDCPGRHLLDKTTLAELAAAAGLEAPPGRTFEDAESLRVAADDIDYPCVVKPVLRTGRRSLSARRFDDARDLRRGADLPGRLIVQPHVADEMHAVAGVMWRGELKVAVHQRHVRIWPPHCGDACYAITAMPDPALEEGLRRLLADVDGIFQAEFAGRFLLDLNPRVYGSLPLAVSAGVNLVGAFCDLLRRADVGHVRARPGIEYHWWEGDLRHVASRWRAGDLGAGEALRALGLKTAIAGADLARWDPKPSVVRLRHVAGQLAVRRSRTVAPGRAAADLGRRPSTLADRGMIG